MSANIDTSGNRRGEKLEILFGKGQGIENKGQFGPQDLGSQTKTVTQYHWLKIIITLHWVKNRKPKHW
jgi:hypothetical protein